MTRLSTDYLKLILVSVIDINKLTYNENVFSISAAVKTALYFSDLIGLITRLV